VSVPDLRAALDTLAAASVAAGLPQPRITWHVPCGDEPPGWVRLAERQYLACHRNSTGGHAICRTADLDGATIYASRVASAEESAACVSCVCARAVAEVAP
jgi:hypothetical protein